jgi:hypothetical protein
MPIDPLPPAPAPTDSRADFANKSFAHVAAMHTFTEQANALQEDVTAKQLATAELAEDADLARLAAEAAATQAAFAAGVTKWVSGTTYSQGAMAWSPANYVSYRRKVAGAGTIDPSADTTNWQPVWASRELARDMGRARTLTAINATPLQAGAVYDVDTTAGALDLPLPLIADTERGDRIELINTHMAWGAPHLPTISRPEAGIRIQGVTAPLVLDLPMTGIALVCSYKDPTQAWWCIA